MLYAVYSGQRILQYGTCPKALAWPGPGTIIYHDIPGPIDRTHYVDESQSPPALTARQPLSATWDKTTIAADGSDAATLSGLPTICTVYVDGVAYDVTDGTFMLSASTIGDYSVIVDEVAYLRQEWTINAD